MRAGLYTNTVPTISSNTVVKNKISNLLPLISEPIISGYVAPPLRIESMPEK